MLRRIWDFLFYKLAVDPVWAIVIGIAGGGSVSFLAWLADLPLAMKVTLGIWAAVGIMLLIVVPQFFYGKSRAARRGKMSDVIFSLIRQGHELKKGTPQHAAWQKMAHNRLRKFDKIWANDFASIKYRMPKGQILENERTKLSVQIVSLREDNDIFLFGSKSATIHGLSVIPAAMAGVVFIVP